VDEPLMLNCFGVESGTPTIESWSARIDRAIATGGTFIFYAHYFTADNLPLFKAIADYVESRRLWTPAINEWWKTLAMQGEAGDVSAGEFLYVSCGEAGVQVMDISDPLSPSVVGGCGTGGAADDVAAYDDGVCAAAGASGLKVIDAQHPATPAVVGSAAAGSAAAQGVCVRGTTAYVAAGADGLRIVSIADPAHPLQLGVLNTPGDARDVVVVGATVYVADGPGGVQAIDASNPAQPVLKRTYVLPAAAEALVVFGGKAYVADGEQGLQVVPL
jgi:hypothetical protein